MSLPFSFFIGQRYASLRARNQLVGFITKLSVIGLGLGVSILITVLSLINGFDRELQTRVLGMVPHISVTTKRNEALFDSEQWQPLISTIRANDGVLNTSEQVQLQGILFANGRSRGIALNGIDVEQERAMSILNDFVELGDYDSLQAGSYNILLGEGLAQYLQLQLGDTVTLASTIIAMSPLGEYPRKKRFTVSGIFKVGSQLDDNFALVQMRDAQKLYRLGNDIHGIRVQVDDLFAVDEVGQELRSSLSGRFLISDWTRDYGAIYENIRLSKTLVGLLLLLLVAVAAFNVIVSLFMVVKDKQGDIAILRTMGTPMSTIRNIFLLQGFIIGLIGTGGGLVFGLIFSYTIGDVFAWLESTFKLELLSADVYPVNYLPSQIQLMDLCLVCAASMIMCLLATLYPAYSAAKVDPAQALRYE